MQAEIILEKLSRWYAHTRDDRAYNDTNVLIVGIELIDISGKCATKFEK